MGSSKIKIAYLTNDTDFGHSGLEVLKAKGFEIVYENFGSKFLELRDLEYDYLLSFCYPHKVSLENLSYAQKCNINFHPAPLPSYKGFAVYNFGILNDEKQWGTTAHIMEEDFDAGSIIRSNSFPIQKETAFSLREKSRCHLLSLLQEVANDILSQKELDLVDDVGGEYYSKKMMNEARVISLEESSCVIERKVRAFWCPPYDGAILRINNNEFTLVNSDIIKTFGR